VTIFRSDEGSLSMGLGAAKQVDRRGVDRQRLFEEL